jgi:hypothetical protein
MDYDYLPSQVNTHYWIYSVDPYMMRTYPYIDGKWVMFFSKEELDERWKEAKFLYKTGRLIGVNSMKVSTQVYNPYAVNKYRNGVIIFYCGPSEDKRHIMKCGRNLLKQIYYNDSILYYKSDKPHLQDNSRKYRNLYELNADNYYKRPRSGMRTVSINEDEPPMAYMNHAQFQMNQPPPPIHHQPQHPTFSQHPQYSTYSQNQHHSMHGYEPDLRTYSHQSSMSRSSESTASSHSSIRSLHSSHKMPIVSRQRLSPNNMHSTMSQPNKHNHIPQHFMPPQDNYHFQHIQQQQQQPPLPPPPPQSQFTNIYPQFQSNNFNRQIHPFNLSQIYY